MSEEDRKTVRIKGASDPADGVQRLNLADMAEARTANRPKVDIVFVIDTTGSMNDKIDGLVASLQTLADRLGSKDADWRAAVVAFGDLTVPGDTIAATPFTGSVQILKRSFSKLPRNNGGANDGESAFEALSKGVSLPDFRAGSIRVAVLITDEPALQDSINSQEMSRRLARANVLAFVVSPPYPYYKQLAKQHGGSWHAVSANTDFSAVVALFDKLTASVAEVVERVQLRAGGSVAEYLRLAGGPKEA